MAYVKQTWTDTSAGGTPISAARLNYMETGIDVADDTADTALSTANSAASDAGTALSAANNADASVTSITADVNASLKETDFSAKGEMFVANGIDSALVLAPGTDGRMFETDSSAPSGLKWGRKITVSASQPASPSVGDLWLQIP